MPRSSPDRNCQVHDEFDETSIGSFNNPMTLEDCIIADTGRVMNRRAFQEKKDRRDKIYEQTERVCDILEGFEIFLRRKSKLSLVGSVSNLVTQLRCYANNNILMAKQVENRKKQLAEVQAWLEALKDDPENKQPPRYLVITSGQRVPITDLSQALSHFFERFAEWKRLARINWSVEVIFRTTEFPVDPKTGTVNLHANVAYQMPYLGEAGMAQFLDWSRWLVGSFVRDCGAINSVNEVVRYVLKADDIDGLESLQLRDLYYATYKRKFYSAYGDFAAFCRRIKANRKQPVIRGGKVVWVWKQRRRRKISLETEASQCKMDPMALREAEGIAPPPPVVLENYLIRMISPTAIASPLIESHGLILNYTPNPITQAGKNGIDGFNKESMLDRNVARCRGVFWPLGGLPDFMKNFGPDGGYILDSSTISFSAVEPIYAIVELCEKLTQFSETS
jgi:hypothetical protein